MTEDKLPPEDSETPQDEPEVIEFELTTREEYIRCATESLSATDSFNAMTNYEHNQKKRILRRCMAIIDMLTAEMYDELFDNRQEEEQD